MDYDRWIHRKPTVLTPSLHRPPLTLLALRAIVLLSVCSCSWAGYTIKISLKDARGHFAVTVQRCDNRQVWRKGGFGTRPVRFEDLPAGSYLVRTRLSTGDEITRTVPLGESGESDGTEAELVLDAELATGSTDAREDLHAVGVKELLIPKQARARFDESWDAAAKQNWPEAKQLLEEAVELAPEFEDALIALAMANRSLGDLKESERCLRAAIALNADSFPALLNLSGLLAKQAKLDEAIPLARRAQQLRPHDLIANLHTGMLFFARKRYRESIPYLLEVAASDPANFENPQLMLMIAYEATGQLGEAIEQAAAWLEHHPRGDARPAVERNLRRLKLKQANRCPMGTCS